MMRRILVDHARRRDAPTSAAAAPSASRSWEMTSPHRRQHDIDVLALHESLERLAAFDPGQERIVELRYFGGLTIEETAEVVGVSPATVSASGRSPKRGCARTCRRRLADAAQHQLFEWSI